MPKKSGSSKPLERRQALKGLAALAVSGPALASIGCGDEDGSAGGSGANAGAGGTGGSSGSGGTAGSGAASGSGGAGGSGTGGSGTGGSGGQGTGGTAGSDAGAPPTFDDTGTCALTTTDIEGPFLIEDGEIPDDPSLVRSDIRDGHAGVEFRFHFRLLDARNNCAPIANAEVYIWHCDADGYYSGFNGQDPATPYTGAMQRTPENNERFCRGVQLSGADGIASFTTIYPGWYAGRPIHVHLIARFSGGATRLITTQLYFPAAFSREVHQSEPAYAARSANIPAASLNPPRGSPAIPRMTHSPGLVVGTLNVIVNGLA
jgi:protocatechuate 3,4-dioxygenase beta subunit